MSFTATDQAPAGPAARIPVLDTLRGVAVLGILLMNITGFGLADAYEVPGAGASGPELGVWIVEMLLLEGTMRGLFTLLFGAGVVLYLDSLERSGLGDRALVWYYRRTLWLLVFGLVNAYLLVWSGDILFFYGVAGLLLYPFRRRGARALLWVAVPLLCVQTVVGSIQYAAEQGEVTRAERALWLEAAGQPLDPGQAADLQAHRERLAEQAEAPAARSATEAAMRAGYLAALRENAGLAWYYQTRFLPTLALWECLGMMILGMAMYRSGALTGRWSSRRYLALMSAGWALGIAVNALEIRHQLSSRFSDDAVMTAWLVTYDLGRIPLTLGHLAAIHLLIRWMPGARAWQVFASVGRMALTNYLAQSVMALFVFTGAGLALFGVLARHELYVVVVAMWVVQLAWSPWWLARFRYGPVEWLWRSLTRWEAQPMRLALKPGI